MNEANESLNTRFGRWSGSGIPLFTIFSAGFSVLLAISISWRLGVLALIVSGLVSAALLLTHIVERYGFPLLEGAMGTTLQWLRARDHRLTRSLTRALEGIGVELPLVVLLTAALIGGAWLFFGMLEDVVTSDPLIAVDQAVFLVLQSLRSPIADAVLIAITELGDRLVITAVVVVGLISLLLIRRWRAALYLGLAALGSTLFVHSMKLVLHRPRPLELYGGISEFSFPSGHATSSLVVYGFLTILLVRSASPALRRALIASVLSLIVLISFSRVYLGAHWLSDVVAGLSFGTAWIAGLAILCFRQERGPLPSARLTIVLAVTAIVAGTWHVSRTHSLDVDRYAPRTLIPSSKTQPQ